jgi:eukaryotic-like serine/threonine-protein kinase
MSRISIACSHSIIDYEPLTDRLKQGDWKGADQLTTAAILRCHGLDESDCLRPEQLTNIPCADLLTIDQLWSNYSDGHFGLAVQLLLWEFLNEDDQKLADRVGWRVNQAWLSSQDISFQADAPIGHLPYVPRFGGMRWGWGEMFYGQFRRCREQGTGLIA